MVLIPFLFMMFIVLEAFRRETFRLVMIHLACVEARSSALGADRKEIEGQTRQFLDSAFGRPLASQFWKASKIQRLRIKNIEELRWLNTPRLPGLLVEGWIRYPQFLSFGHRGKKKHHEEITQRCLFPFS